MTKSEIKPEQKEYTVRLACLGVGASPEEAVFDVVRYIKQGGEYIFDVREGYDDDNTEEETDFVQIDTESNEYRAAVGLPLWED